MTAKKASNENAVNTINNLQSLLSEGVTAMRKVKEKDLAWARSIVGAVNSGNALIRTAHKLAG